MGRSTNTRRKLNETQKATVKGGLNKSFLETFKDGNYIVYEAGKLTLVKLKAAAAQQYHQQGARLKQVSDSFVKSLEAAAKVSKKQLEEFSKHYRLHADKKHKKEVQAYSKKISNNQELKTTLESVARVGVALVGIYADLGAKAESAITVKGKTFSYETKLFAEVKAGIRAGLLGVSAQVSAEAGLEEKVAANIKNFKTKSGADIRIQLYCSVKGYAKTEAYAGIGLATKTGAIAMAGIGVEVKVGGEIFRKLPQKEEELAGGIASTFAVEAGAIIGATAGINIKEIFDNGLPYTEITVGISAKLFTGATLSIVGVVLSDLYKEAKDEITKQIKSIATDVILKQIEEEAKRIQEQIKYGVKDSAQKMSRGWENTQNYGNKLVISIEEGIGFHQKAMESEIQRQVKKLEQYKRELTTALKQFKSTKNKDLKHFDQIMQAVNDDTFKQEVLALKNQKANDKLLKKKLEESLARYKRRINKLNQFLNDSYKESLQKVKADLQSLNTMIGQFQTKDVPKNFQSSKDYKVMEKKIQGIQTMIVSIEKIIDEKRKLLKEVMVDPALERLIKEMTQQYQQIKKDFQTFHDTIKSYVASLPKKK